VIDEISMVSAEIFEMVDEIARIVRNDSRPFGGIQMIVSGDFFQLPPVPKKLMCPYCASLIVSLNNSGGVLKGLCKKKVC
jgi:hypothetical protein